MFSHDQLIQLVVGVIGSYHFISGGLALLSSWLILYVAEEISRLERMLSQEQSAPPARMARRLRFLHHARTGLERGGHMPLNKLSEGVGKRNFRFVTLRVLECTLGAGLILLALRYL